MGNGSYYLYELNGRELRLLLATRGVDQHADLNLIQGNHLEVDYRDLNADGHVDIEFTGTVEEYSDDVQLERPPRTYPCRKVYVWNPRLNRFTQDKSQRRGFDSYSENQD